MFFTSGQKADKNVPNKAIDCHNTISGLSFRRNLVRMTTPPRTSSTSHELIFQFTQIGYNQLAGGVVCDVEWKNLRSTWFG
jgi:hypothetical protein